MIKRWKYIFKKPIFWIGMVIIILLQILIPHSIQEEIHKTLIPVFFIILLFFIMVLWDRIEKLEEKINKKS